MYEVTPAAFVAERRGTTETDPRVVLLLFGPSAPFLVFTVQFGSADRTTRMVLSTLLLLAQKGHVAEVREDIEVISMSADPPDQASGSFPGSLPE